MPLRSKATLQAEAVQIANETSKRANTATRVGNALLDVVDSTAVTYTATLVTTATGAVNAATLQAALTAVPAGGSVSVTEPGTYPITSLTLSGGRKLRLGDGVVLQWAANTGTAMFAVSGADCGIIGGKLDGNGANQAGSVIAITLTTAPRFVFRDVEVTNFKYKFLLTDEGGELSPDGRVLNCNVHDMGLVIDCDIFGIRSSRWIVRDTRFKDITQAGHCVRFGLYNAGPAAVVDSKVIGCSFNDSVEVGVVCEIYTQGIEIIGNSFRTLQQGVKCENAGSTVSGVNIIGNEFRGLTLSTGFNWTVPGTFANNRCYDCAAGIEIFKDAIVIGNYLENCGTASEGAIHLFTGGSGRFTIADNTIVNPVGSGIILGTANCDVHDNTIRNVSASGKFGIDVDKDNQLVHHNVIDTVATGATGIRIVSTCTNSQVRDNQFLNLTGSGLTATNGASFYTCLVKDNLGIAQLALDHNIVSGVFTIGLSSVDVVMNTEGGGATDDLDTMTATTNLPKNHIVILRDNSSSNDVTVKHNTGNILLAGAADFTLLTSAYKIALMWSGTKWNELWRAVA